MNRILDTCYKIGSIGLGSFLVLFMGIVIKRSQNNSADIPPAGYFVITMAIILFIVNLWFAKKSWTIETTQKRKVERESILDEFTESKRDIHIKSSVLIALMVFGLILVILMTWFFVSVRPNPTRDFKAIVVFITFILVLVQGLQIALRSYILYVLKRRQRKDASLDAII